MGGSVASVITGTDDLCDELVLDSGSVSTARPYAWCSDISVNNEGQGVSARHSATKNVHRMDQGWHLSIVVSRRDVLSANSNLMLQVLRTQLCRWER